MSWSGIPLSRAREAATERRDTFFSEVESFTRFRIHVEMVVDCTGRFGFVDLTNREEGGRTEEAIVWSCRAINAATGQREELCACGCTVRVLIIRCFLRFSFGETIERENARRKNGARP